MLRFHYKKTLSNVIHRFDLAYKKQKNIFYVHKKSENEMDGPTHFLW